MTTKPLPPSDIADKFMLRLPEGMRERIRVEAQRNGRSMNTEIVSRLEKSLGFDDDKGPFSNLLSEYYRLTDRLNLVLPLVMQLQPEEVEQLLQRKDTIDLYHSIERRKEEAQRLKTAQKDD